MQKSNAIPISVIMTVYNSRRFLPEAIESVLSQTFGEFELIIINDCSSDNSLEIIRDYHAKDQRIILIDNRVNLGRAKARNKGLEIAKGRYIAVLDSDDVALPQRFEIQYNFLEKSEDIFLLGGEALNVDEDGQVTFVKKIISDPKKMKKCLTGRNCIYHSTVMYRNEFVFYREKFPYAQDYDFYLCLLSEGKKLVNIPKVLIKYRVNSEAVSWVESAKQKLFAEKAKEFYGQRLIRGKDEYDKFDPNEILNIDVEKSASKIVLESEIRASFKLNNFKRTREICKKYFRSHGFLNKAIPYYFLSFTGKKIISLIRKIIFDFL